MKNALKKAAVILLICCIGILAGQWPGSGNYSGPLRVSTVYIPNNTVDPCFTVLLKGPFGVLGNSEANTPPPSNAYRLFFMVKKSIVGADAYNQLLSTILIAYTNGESIWLNTISASPYNWGGAYAVDVNEFSISQ